MQQTLLQKFCQAVGDTIAKQILSSKPMQFNGLRGFAKTKLQEDFAAFALKEPKQVQIHAAKRGLKSLWGTLYSKTTTQNKLTALCLIIDHNALREENFIEAKQALEGLLPDNHLLQPKKTPARQEATIQDWINTFNI